MNSLVRMILARGILILLSALLPGLSLAETPMPEYNSSYSRDLEALQEALRIKGFQPEIPLEFARPTHGSLSFMLNARQAPWAGNYFPMAKGGLANRWQTHKKIDLEKLPNPESVAGLSQRQINVLSPIEKFDLFLGDYSFKGTHHELNKRGPLRPWPVANWEGFCNGVRCAGIHLPEPKHAINVVNPDGITIKFQPADLKALAGAAYFFVENYSQMGGPSGNQARAENQPNAAIFDMALRYYVAEKKSTFVIDSHLGSEIWNETVVGFRRQLTEPEPLSQTERALYPKAVQKRTVQLELFSLADVSIRESNKATKENVASGNYNKVTKAVYTLYLDANNMAVDGAWKKSRGLRGIDFLWFSGGAGTDSKNPEGNGNQFLRFEVIEKLVRLSSKPLSCQKILRQ